MVFTIAEVYTFAETESTGAPRAVLPTDNAVVKVAAKVDIALKEVADGSIVPFAAIVCVAGSSKI